MSPQCPSCYQPLVEGQKFCRNCGAAVAPITSLVSNRFGSPQEYTPGHLAERILLSKEAVEGERKQVTVLFADLKGSMELLAERDPEEARKVLDPVLEKMIEAVHRYDGTVNQVMGDGIMALFGAPLALEDHAVRACYAALAMQSSIRGYGEELRRSQGVTARIRVGLNSGEVVVRAIGSDLHMDYTAVGQTTHLAARMEQLADAGATLLTSSTLKFAEGFIAVKPQGPVPVKGLREPVEIYELTGAGAARSRIQAAAVRGLTKFVGRNIEIGQINHALERAHTGRGQLVAMIGEPGVGKSRLVWEFIHSHRVHDWLVLESASVSYGKASAYRPLIDLLKNYFQIEERDDDRRVREKVAGKLVMLDRDLEPILPALLFLLDAPLEDAQWQRLEPTQKRLRILDACKRLLLREAQVQPMVLVFEDLHWVDTETQSFLDGMVESLPAARILLLVNYRPEYQQRWTAKTYYQQMRIDPLAGESADALLDALVGADPALTSLKRMLIERTEGNPLFLEESVRTLIETGQLVGSRGAYALSAPATGIRMPATVQAILAARIDRLSPKDKRLLQAAAIVGKDVPYALLEKIADMADSELRTALAQLQTAEFLYEASLFPELEYTFKHALTHEVAYGSLLQDRRRALHVRIMEAIEQLYVGRTVERVEQLAHHALRGELWQKAANYLQRSGDKAFSRGAHREQVLAYEQALAALDHLPESRDRLEQAIDICLLLRIPFSPLAEAAKMLTYARTAERFAVKLNDTRRRGQVAVSLCQASNCVGELSSSLEHAKQVVTLGAELADMELQDYATYWLGLIKYQQGSYREAIASLLPVAASPANDSHVTEPQEYDAAAAPAASVYAANALVWAPALATLCYGELGEFQKALDTGKVAQRNAAARALSFEQGYVEYTLGAVHLLKGELELALPMLERCREIGLTTNASALLIWVAPALALLYDLLGRAADAISLLEEAKDSERAGGNVQYGNVMETSLGRTYALLGRTAQGVATLESAIKLAHAHERRGEEAWALFCAGDVQMMLSPPDLISARKYYTQAIALARELAMRPLTALCHLGLGRLACMAGDSEEGREQAGAAGLMLREMDTQFWLEEAESFRRSIER